MHKLELSYCFVQLVSLLEPFKVGQAQEAVCYVQLAITQTFHRPLLSLYAVTRHAPKMTDNCSTGSCAVWQSVTACCFLCSWSPVAWFLIGDYCTINICLFSCLCCMDSKIPTDPNAITPVTCGDVWWHLSCRPSWVPLSSSVQVNDLMEEMDDNANR